MTHPVYHAISSARIYGGVWQDYIPVHHYLDATKEAFCDFRHRAMRHHAQGIFWAETIYGHEILNSAGKTVPVRYVGEQHIIEDCGRIPTIDDWLERFHPGSVKPIKVDAVSQAQRSAEVHGGRLDDYLALHQWFEEPRAWSTRPGYGLFRHHTEGIAWAEKKFGAFLTLADGTVVSVRTVAERHVADACGGHVPCLGAWLTKLRRALWMARATRVHGHLTRRGQDDSEAQPAATKTSASSSGGQPGPGVSTA